MKATINLYVGSPETDVVGTYLYLELVIPGVGEYEIRGTERLDDRADADILDEFQKTLNIASLTRKALGIPVRIDMEELKLLFVELELGESVVQEIKNLIRDFQDEMKGRS